MAKVVLIGAGSAIFATRMISGILSYPELADSTISLVDIDPERLKTAEKMARNYIEQNGNKARLEASLDRKAALKKADYVISCIKVGGYDITKKDFDIPLKYGLKQTIGDTVGIGGISRALRTTPVILEIARDIEKICPNALFMNYTNPMHMLCLAMFRKFKGINAVGMCHSVQATAKHLANYINVPVCELSYWVAGINHMAWFLTLKHNGKDAYPLVHKAALDSTIYEKDRVKFEMLKRTGYFVSESSTHMAEYLPYFMKRDDIIDEFKLVHGQHLLNVQRQIKNYEEMKAKLERGENIPAPNHDEYAPEIIYAIETGKQMSFVGNVYNTGLITNLPSDSCIEVSCMVDKEGIHPCHAGNLPTVLAALNSTNISVHQLVVEAILTGKKQYVYQAAMMDPNTSSVLSLDEIWRMTDELMEAHGNLIPALK